MTSCPVVGGDACSNPQVELLLRWENCNFVTPDKVTTFLIGSGKTIRVPDKMNVSEQDDKAGEVVSVGNGENIDVSNFETTDTTLGEDVAKAEKKAAVQIGEKIAGVAISKVIENISASVAEVGKHVKDMATEFPVAVKDAGFEIQENMRQTVKHGAEAIKQNAEYVLEALETEEEKAAREAALVQEAQAIQPDVPEPTLVVKATEVIVHSIEQVKEQVIEGAEWAAQKVSAAMATVDSKEEYPKH
jgi:hypothetical protein